MLKIPGFSQSQTRIRMTSYYEDLLQAILNRQKHRSLIDRVTSYRCSSPCWSELLLNVTDLHIAIVVRV